MKGRKNKERKGKERKLGKGKEGKKKKKLMYSWTCLLIELGRDISQFP